MRVWSARSRIDRFGFGFVRCGGGGEDVFAGAGAGVNQAGIAQLLERAFVDKASFTLVVGCEGAAAIGTFLPLEAEPAQVLEHGGDELRLASREVQVFVAQDQAASSGLCALLRDPECARVAEVQVAGRGRREAAAVARGMGGMENVGRHENGKTETNQKGTAG